MKKYQTWLLLVLCNLFWAGNYVFAKFVIQEMTPFMLTFYRWAFALVLLFPIAHFLERPDWKQARKAWVPLVALGVLGGIGYNILLYSALSYTSPTNAALVSALNPGMIVLFSVFLLKERVSGVQIAGFLLSLVGVIVILTQGSLGQIFHTEYNRGDLIMIVAVVVWSLYSIIGKRLANIPPITVTALSTLIAVLMMAPFAAREGIDLETLSPLALTGVVYIVIFPSVCSFVFWNVSVRAIGASQAGIFLNLIPVFTAIISAMLGQPVTGSQILGGLLVFAGVYLTTGMLERGWARRTETGLKAGRE